MIEVYKAGGYVTGSAENIHKLRDRLHKCRFPMVLVVSAMEKVTDDLVKKIIPNNGNLVDLKEKHIALAKELGVYDRSLEIGLDNYMREIDPALGERLILPIVERYLGVELRVGKIRSYHLGIRTKRKNGDNVLDKECGDNVDKQILRLLNRKDVLIVTGYEARGENDEVTTLKRDGSDSTATFIANCTDANAVYLLKKNPILTGDPDIVKAKPVKFLKYETAAESGGLQFSSLAYAKERDIVVYVESIDDMNNCTRVSSESFYVDQTKEIVIGGLEECKLLTVDGISDMPGAEDEIRKLLIENEVNKVIQAETRHSVSYVLNDPDDRYELLNRNLEKMVRIIGKDRASLRDCSLISMSGIYSNEERELFFRLAKSNVLGSWISGKTSCYIAVPKEDYKPTIKDIHKRLVEERDVSNMYLN